MNIFDQAEVTDRRRKENVYLSILVDLGVTYRRTLGLDPARSFFNDHGVPGDVAARVFERKGARRPTEWEAASLNRVQDLEMKT